MANLLGIIPETLGNVPVTNLPVAPEYMRQKAMINAVFALALGLYTYVNPVPKIIGGPNQVRLLTHDSGG